MPPLIATGIFAIGVLGLFVCDRDPKVRTSRALWIPILWMMLAGSRTVTEWWMPNAPRHTMHQFVESNPVERNILLALIGIGLIVLAVRARKTLAVIGMNVPLLLFLFYGAASLFWSDFPDIAFKRWVKALGDIVIITIVVTDPEPGAAVKRLLARVSFILVPASILVIKYFPALGHTYGRWDGRRHVIGIAEDKNMLGLTCLVLGIAAVWRSLHALRQGHYRQLAAHGTIAVMVVYLFSKANSVTSMACFAMAVAIIFVTTSRTLGQRRLLVHSTVMGLMVFAFAVLFLNVGSSLVESMGRDATTLTGRTALWQQLPGMSPNIVLGAGFESFWLGRRIERLWAIFAWEPNEAHNGYLEVFLNLGIIGVTLLALVIVTGYRNALAMLRRDTEGGSLRLAYLVVGLTYSFTEAGFRMMSPVWISFVLGAIAVPAAQTAAAAKGAVAQVAGRIPRPSAVNVRRVPLRPLGRTT
jgi:exopolysaccharide production protein ExoQ